MSKSFVYELVQLFKVIIILLLGFLLIVGSFSINVDWLTGLSLLEKFIYQHRFFTDFFQFCALAILLFNGNLILRILGLMLACVFTFFYFVQSQSFSITGQYFPSIALENAAHIDFLDIDKIVFSGLIWSILFLLVSCILWRNLVKVSYRTAVFMAVFLAIISVAIKNDDAWLSDAIVAARFEFYNSGIPGVENKSPLGELFVTLDEYSAYLVRQNFISNKSAILSSAAAAFVYDEFTSFAELDDEYTLAREFQFNEEIPFFSAQTALNENKYNVIVFFIEGMSARLVEPYYNHFPGLTPNLSEFSEKAIKVNNYYNHSFATFRGIAGQMCSLFPVGKLYQEVNYRCLGHILKEHGYNSRFMFSQRVETTELDEVALQAGFDIVDGATRIRALLGMPIDDFRIIVPDRVLIDGLIKRLQELENDQNKNPTFIGLYNYETHTGTSLFERTTVYPRKDDADDENRVLNTFHNFDKEFGRFWEYFRNSSLFDNTIVVVTSDHATFPSVEFKELMVDIPDYTKLFVDEIPLLIHHPDLQEAVVVEKNTSTSLDLAPSLLHLLNISDVRASFLGESLFSTKSSPFPYTAVGTSRMWFADDNFKWGQLSVNTQAERLEQYPKQVDKFEFIQYLFDLERNNKVWPSDSRFERKN